MISRTSSGKSAPGRPPGYVLLAVLVCLLVAGLTMTMVAQCSLRLSTTALERQHDLQRKWGMISCQRSLLPAAPRLFAKLQERAADRSGPAPATFSASVKLGGSQFDLLLADENAKLNLNAVFHHRGRTRTEQMAGRNLPALYRPPVRLQPEVRQGKPLDALLAGAELPDALRSWGQVFDLSLATSIPDHRWMMPHWTARMTLWGHGRLNVRRTSDAALMDACQLIVSEGAARRFQTACRDHPDYHIDALIRQLDVDREKQLLLQDMFTVQSSCFSLWTTVRGVRVEAQRLAVLQVDDEGVTGTTEFLF